LRRIKTNFYIYIISYIYIYIIYIVDNCLIIEYTYVFNCRLKGELVETALANNKPVVNVQWLNDILFGAKLGIKDPANLKYQQFDLCNPFIVNYDMVSHLMGMV